jgi:hypothetical protein
MPAQADHLVVSAATLDEGVAWVESQLGVSLSPRRGGEHQGKGTHNVLLSLGPELYLEIIALNPDAPTRTPPRWSWLDNLPADAPPSLDTWLVRTPDLASALAASSIKPGELQSMSRGSLHWQITLTPDGSLPADGAMPAFIQWHQDTPHPVTANLPDVGARLLKLEIRHQDAAAIADSLRAIGLDDARINIEALQGPKLVATFDTPEGVRILSSRS